MARGRRPTARQVYERPIIEWPNGVKPWDAIDKADEELGWEYRWIDHRRAVDIRHEIEASRGKR